MSSPKISQLVASVIIPTFNERTVIKDCIFSLFEQEGCNIEIIVVDDGSDDGTVEVVKNLSGTQEKFDLRLFARKHSGPGEARNFGGMKANGKILVFVDADMTFDKKFIKSLIYPIINGTGIGTDSQEEYLANPENYWARCWNIGRFSAANSMKENPLSDMVPNKQDFGGIFRAILKSEFLKVGGFEKGGDYADDGSLAKKLKTESFLAKGAVFYHKNPASLDEVWRRASWIGSGKNFTSSFSKKLLNIIKFSFPVALIKGIIISVKYKYTMFIPFKLVYDCAVWTSVLKSIL